LEIYFLLFFVLKNLNRNWHLWISQLREKEPKMKAWRKLRWDLVLLLFSRSFIFPYCHFQNWVVLLSVTYQCLKPLNDYLNWMDVLVYLIMSMISCNSLIWCHRRPQKKPEPLWWLEKLLLLTNQNIWTQPAVHLH